ncbi:hypothetical protein CERZMDRAFT_114623 [Cercospora zeae-maydis SCOH1-5]|uniref:Uncharacterized protein n=1 Tax=Cercospora zeae-maydis SCOH1-5 TaxID=717836 RepID=A0A6A6F6Z0_9PEZI|nr:hypothetical protein CERZMDRAFT_114623 [Cercospora zeae-maydis SCOH1-5]
MWYRCGVTATRYAPTPNKCELQGGKICAERLHACSTHENTNPPRYKPHTRNSQRIQQHQAPSTKIDGWVTTPQTPYSFLTEQQQKKQTRNKITRTSSDDPRADHQKKKQPKRRSTSF